MGCKCQTIITAVEAFAPKRLAQSWDNVGLMVGDTKWEVNKLLIALDSSEDVIDYAIENKFDMIITHHPLIFSPIKSVRGDLPSGRKIIKLIQNKICLYSAHTNFDSTKGGVTDALCDKIGLKETKILDITGTDKNDEPYGIGKVGKIDDAMTVLEYAKIVKNELNIEHVNIIGDPNAAIRKVAVCGGSGSSLISKASYAGADVLVTGDIQHHDALDAIELGLNIIDAGHFSTENIAMPVLFEHLKSTKNLKELKIELYTNGNAPMKVF